MDKHPTPTPTPAPAPALAPAPAPTPHTPYPAYPYPCYPYYPRRSSSGKKANLASCVVATAFLILVLFVAALVFFLLFRPRDPDVRIRAVQLPGFAIRSSATNTNTNTNTAASFTFAQSASVRNPNRAAFSHYDSTITLLYRGSQLGFMYIPAGEIGGGRTQYMEASFAVPQFPLSKDDGKEMEVEARMKLKGRVKVLKFFIHHVEVTAACRLAIAPGNGAVLRVRC